MRHPNLQPYLQSLGNPDIITSGDPRLLPRSLQKLHRNMVDTQDQYDAACDSHRLTHGRLFTPQQLDFLLQEKTAAYKLYTSELKQKIAQFQETYLFL